MSVMEITNSSLEDVVADRTTEILTVIQFAYGAPTILFMAHLLVALTFKKEFSMSFYKLVRVDLVVNMMCWFNTWIAVRLDAHPIGVVILKQLELWVPGCLTASKLLTNFFFHMHVCTGVSLSIHRITSVLHPLTYEKFWSKWYLAITVGFVIYSFLPIFILFPGFSFSVSIVDGVLIKYRNPHALLVNATKIGIFCTSYFITIVFVGCFMSLLASKVMNESNANDRRVSRKLTRIALTYAIVYVGELIWSDLNAFNRYLSFLPDSFLQFNNISMTFVADMMTLALPYIMLVFDENVKRHVLLQNRNAT